MTADELLEALRVRLDDATPPYLWSDEELLGYLDQAHEEAAVRARRIAFDTRDAAPVIAPVALEAARAEYPRDARILEIRRGLADGVPLARADEEALDRFCGRGWERETGTPRAYLERPGGLRLYPVPQADGVLHLSGFRLPRGRLGEVLLAPELPEADHYHLLDGASALAYLKSDAETVNRERAAESAGRFSAWFGERFSANQERKRLEARSRTVRTGGGYW